MTLMQATLAVGQPVTRVEGRAKVTGFARYAADFAPDELTHAAIVGAGIAAGRVVAVDAAQALAVPGVLAVLTHANTPQLNEIPNSPLVGDWRTPLSDARVDYAGQAVAVVVAQTPETAKRAARMVNVEIEPDARAPVIIDGLGAAAVVAGAEVAGTWRDQARGDAALALVAPGVVRLSAVYTSPTEHHNPMEPSATLAVWAGESSLTVYDSTQNVSGTADALAMMFGLAANAVRVVCPFVGGGFGCKGPFWPHTVLAAMAAREVGRPVRLALDRQQMFTSVGERPYTVQTLRIGATEEGVLRAIDHRTVNVVSQQSTWIEPCGRLVSAAMYACPNVTATHEVTRGHIPPGTWMRAPGEAPGAWALESMIDELALELGIDPIELRLGNDTAIDQITRRPWSDRNLRECLELGAERFGWHDRDPVPRSMRDGDLLVGCGVAAAIFHAQRRPVSVRLGVDRLGGVRLQTAVHDLGTGTYTICAQILADALGTSVDRIEVQLGDSAFPKGTLAGGSATAASVVDATIAASARLRAKADAPASGPVDWAAAVQRSGRTRIDVEVDTPDAGDSSAPWSPASHGACFCEVTVNPLEARVRVRRVVSVWDVGRVLNPKTARSQIAGSIVMAIGMALMEETFRDPLTGRPVNDNLADYMIPVNADIGDLEIEFLDRPDPVFGALGARGIGELGMIGIVPAIGNAVHHATGHRFRDLPITPARLLPAL